MSNLKRLVLLPIIALLCAFTYGYKNNTQTGKPDMVVTGATVSDVGGLSAGYVGTSHFNDYSAARAADRASLATVATTGAYNDLIGKPTIPPAQVNSDWTAGSGVAQILNKPTLGGFALLTPGTLNNTNLCTSDGTTIACTTSSALFQPAGSYPTGTGVDSGTNTGDVTIGTANGLSLSGQVLSIQAATNSQSGVVTASDYVAFAAKQNALTAGVDYLVPDNTVWAPFTPIVSVASGAITSLTATGSYKQLGKTVFVDIQISITTNGTGAGFVMATLPVTSSTVGGALAGRERANVGKGLSANIGTTSLVYVTNYDGSYPGADGNVLAISGVYQAN